MCYNCDKADHYRKNCIVQDQIEMDKKIINKARMNNLDIDEKWKINNVEMKHNNDSSFDSRKE